jgi:hypothetical protein
VPGRHLVEIESQEENDLLSELLYQNSRVTNMMNEVLMNYILKLNWGMLVKLLKKSCKKVFGVKIFF